MNPEATPLTQCSRNQMLEAISELLKKVRNLQENQGGAQHIFG